MLPLLFLGTSGTRHGLRRCPPVPSRSSSSSTFLDFWNPNPLHVFSSGLPDFRRYLNSCSNAKQTTSQGPSPIPSSPLAECSNESDVPCSNSVFLSGLDWCWGTMILRTCGATRCQQHSWAGDTMKQNRHKDFQMPFRVNTIPAENSYG